MTKIPLVAFIGEPNVGKSTLMKRITGLSKIITADEQIGRASCRERV